MKVELSTKVNLGKQELTLYIAGFKAYKGNKQSRVYDDPDLFEKYVQNNSAKITKKVAIYSTRMGNAIVKKEIEL